VRKTTAGLLSLALASGLGAALTVPTSAASPSAGPEGEAQTAAPSDSLPDPINDKQQALRQEAVTAVINGEATPQRIGNSTVVKVGEAETAASAVSGRRAASATKKAQYVELAREDTDHLFVLVVQFGSQRHPSYPDVDINPDIPGPTVFDGPLFNAIPEPNRAVDNTTDWDSDYGKAYYQDLYFGDGSVTGRESMRQYYERQSFGRYSVEGLVTDPVTVPFNEARYGRSDGFPCLSNVCSNTWNIVRDGMNAWVAQQLAAGQTPEQIAATLADYDVWDRYDWDADGNFDEPDGYIDHLQIVHAGGDQADGDPYQGEDAIWSHRWRAFQGTNPAAPIPPIGGTPVGATGIWAADYTIQPENGGLSVVAHEFGHDLGLPDHYDTAGGGDNAVSWWTLMAQSRVSAEGDQAIGSRAADLSAWDKLQLGWLDYEVVVAGQRRTLELGPHEFNTNEAQAAVVVLPQKEVVHELGAPAAGANQWYSGAGDEYEATLSRQVSLPAGTASLTFQARWNIEDCGPDPCDYAYVEVDNGSGWTAIPGSIGTAAEGNGIDGVQDDWAGATFDLSAYSGSTVGLRFRYSTDGAVQGQDPDLPSGIFLDEIAVNAGGQVVFTDGAEQGDNGWTVDGFSAAAGSFTTLHDNYYLASYRTYESFDQYLRTGPYNFGFPGTRPDFVEHFPYQDGLLVSYWDTSYSDNNESQHPGNGEILPIDANARPIYKLDGLPWRGRIQTYDAPFSLQKSDSFTLHDQATGQASYIRGQSAKPVFDDTKQYWYPELPNVGVKVPAVGVKISVLDQKTTTMRIRIS